MLRLDEELKGSFILAADTVVAVGRRILPKAELLDEAAQCLRLLSGRNHRVHTAICLVTPKETFRQRHVETRVRFKRLSDEDIEAYLASGEWRGKAGGYAAQGIAGTFIVKIVGSYTSIVGLPLYETVTLLGRRGLSDPFRLAQRPVNIGAPQAARRPYLADARASRATPVRFAASPPSRRPAVLLAALRRCRSQPLAFRRLCRAGDGRRGRGRTAGRERRAPENRPSDATAARSGQPETEQL